jgi:hypothetical protein
MTFKIPLFFFGIIIAAPPLSSQVPIVDSAVQFRTLGWEVAPDDLYYEYKGKDTKLKVMEASRSIFYNHKKSDKIIFYRLVQGPEGKFIREDATEANITLAGTWPLLVFMKNPADKKKYKVAAISDDLTTFPAPSCRFINLTSVELQAKYGDQWTTIPGKGMELINPKLKSNDKIETRYTQIYVKTDKDPLLIYTNNWVVKPTQRTLTFIFPGDESIRIMRIVDDIGQYIRTDTLN